jgi:hypothetical protein
VLAALFTFTSGRADDEKPKEDKDAEATKKLLLKADEEYRRYFKKPEKAAEYWAAIKFELDVGKFDLAALFVKLLVEKEPADPVDADLASIENVEGMAGFLRLTTIKKWSDHPPFQKEAEKNVQKLLDRVTAAVDKSLSDPKRFAKFIPQLDAPTEEERAFAFGQINRAKERAASYLVEALDRNVGKPLHQRLVEAMVLFDAEVATGWLEALKAKDRPDAQNSDLRLTLLDIVSRRNEKRAIPYLWHMSAATMYPPQVNARARQVLAQLQKTDASKLPPPRIALVELSERYYQHKAKFPPGDTVRIWPWNGTKLATSAEKMTVRQAEEVFGLRYAREALDLDRTYLPAQIAFLNMTLDREYGRDLEQVLLKPMPASLQQLLGRIDADLLLRVLERGLDDGNVPVILAATQALGDRGEVRAARAAVGGAPQGVTRALYYPDRRVQFAAVKALLRMPASPVPVASVRVVDVLRRFLAAGPTGKALVVYVTPERHGEIRQALKESSLEPLFAKNLKEGFPLAGGPGDVEVIFLDGSAGKELSYAITQIRADADQGNVPIFLVAAKENRYALEKFSERYRNVKVISEGLLVMGEELKGQIESAIREASGAPIAAGERKEFKQVSLDYLWRMARNEIQGYDVRPAQEAVTQALNSPDTATEALEILSRLPGAEPQTRLAGVVLDEGRDKMRIAAALELNRHVQKHGLLLNKTLVTELKSEYKNSADPQLKAQLAITLGALRSSPVATGSRLIEFQPAPAAPAPMPDPKKDEKKEEKKEDK